MAQATNSLQQTPYFAEGSDAMIALEGMIDAAGLNNVIWALAYICWAKADHVRSNWQDEPLARGWDANAKMLDRFVERLR